MTKVVRIDNLVTGGANWMRIVNQVLIEEFKRKHAGSRRVLDNWVDIVESCSWRHMPDLKATFPAADYVAPYTIFNLAGNNFRLVAVVIFSKGELAVVKIMTHSEYDRWKP